MATIDEAHKKLEEELAAATAAVTAARAAFAAEPSEANKSALADAEQKAKNARLKLAKFEKLAQAARDLPNSPDEVEAEQTNYGSRLPAIVGMGTYLLLITLVSVLFLASLMMAENPPIVANKIDDKEQITCGKQVKDVVRENSANTQTTAGIGTPTNTATNIGNTGTNLNAAALVNSTNNASRNSNAATPTARNANTNTNTAANANVNTNTNTNPAVNVNSSPAAPLTNSTLGNSASTPSIKAPVNPKVAIAKQLCVDSFGFFADSRFFAADSYLFLVVLFAGMMGGAVRGMSSFFRHIGYGDFSFKWAWYYILLPFSGATLGIVIYLVLRGGFYGGSFDEGLNLNVFSFAALAAVTGLFSENALEKLRQVAVTLLAEVPPKVQNAQEMVDQRKIDGTLK